MKFKVYERKKTTKFCALGNLFGQHKVSTAPYLKNEGLNSYKQSWVSGRAYAMREWQRVHDGGIVSSILDSLYFNVIRRDEKRRDGVCQPKPGYSNRPKKLRKGRR